MKKNFKRVWLAVAIGIGVGAVAALLGLNSGGLTVAIIVFASLIAFFAMGIKRADGRFTHDGFWS